MNPTPTPVCDNYVIISGEKICSKLVGINSIADVVNKMMPLVMTLGGIVFFLALVWGGFDLMTSAGSPEKVKSARAKITTGLIGFLLLIFAFAITKLISYILGFQGFF